MVFSIVWPGRLALALSLFVSTGAAAEPIRMTAAEAVERALSREQWQEEWQTNVELARGDLTLAKTLPNPSILASRENLVEAGATGTETTVMLSQSFDLGGRRRAGIHAAEAGLAVAEAQAARDRSQVRSDTLLAYYRTVAAESVLTLRGKALSELEGIAGIAGRRHAAGDLSGYEARRIRQAAEEARASHSDAEAEVAAARAALVAWIGADAAHAVLDDSLPAAALPESDEIGSATLDVLRAEQAHAQAQLDVARRPSLPVTVGVGRKRLRLGSMTDDAVVLELGIDLPLFDRRQGERIRASAALSLAEARREREERQLQVARDA